MEEEKTLLNEVTSESYNASDRPFDFVGAEGLTALVCEPDPAVREKIGADLKALGYQVTAPATAKDALKAMRFHIFDVVVLNELFDTADAQANDVLKYLENMAMATRRRFFVALVSGKYRTMDNKAFYHVFQETLQKMGKA